MSFNKSFVSRGVVEGEEEKLDGSEVQASAPIQDYDPRTLFERLQEQRNIKDEEFHEATRLSNLIKLVDADEAEFYKTLSDEQKSLDEKRKMKEKDELETYRKAVEQARLTAPPPPTLAATVSATSVTMTQTSLKSTKRKSVSSPFQGLVVKKKKIDGQDENSEPKSTPTSISTPKAAESKPKVVESKPKETLNPLGSLVAYSDDSSDEED
ncbi:N-terminal domain of NEFA-interacting nuclear protein NIP30-domain-containing protein [Phycomyces blakesleeanus]|uniref:FAM192A/Fyv6 N-terminal domain-containing protein n=2 Tax=Phycomyces blakesleeanus TaxID=4837 RepID=A0A167R6F3_PHYB8|nr:hypothetical protein PHYBLDRAFT_76903 [Phycomyces blakesleeanus NRRL 1555(-)]OAD80958.1 hypothetical protein PHYBLDRAFT_76903 [Phycomyces blakesleeanus NRRL 1555(-)]|eukprot:XP_018298998.1 hypothetical protein PHYBLDRAFT_76903 [Phycomyces blakesleeanus NRRL 1555(-)]